MANKYTALDPLFDDIAAAIRFKEGTAEIIPAEDFPERIRAIQSGGIQLESIAIVTPPAKTSYRPGETFDPAGMVVSATYSNGATAVVTGVSYGPDGPLSLSDTAVTISYMEYGVTATATQAVTVQNEQIALPTQSGTLTYTGSEQVPQWIGYDSAKMTMGGTTAATNAGSYDAAFTPAYGYCWADGTTTEKQAAWTIGKAAGSVSLDKTSVTLNASSPTAVVNVTTTGDGTLSVSSGNTSVATAALSGAQVTITGVGSGAVGVTARMAEGTNYTAASAVVQVSVQFTVVIGVKWDSSNSSTAMSRLTTANDPNGLVNTDITSEPVPAVGNGAGSSPFDNYMPWKGMEEYNIINGEVSYKRGDVGFSRSSYDTMVKVPEYYCKVINSGDIWYFYVADSAVSGFLKHPGSGKYVGRYNTGAGYVSKTGTAPLVSITRADARTGSAAKGSKWSQYDFASWGAVEFLFRVEFADWDSQSKVGRGYVDGNSAAINNGATDSMVYHTGRAAGENGKTAVQYRHIENPWGNVWEWIDGVNFSNRVAYICTVKDNYVDDTEDGYTNSGVLLPGSGWAKGLSMGYRSFPWAFLPNANGGSETEFIPDYVYSNTGWRVLYVGGDWSNGSYAGLWGFGANSASSGSSAGIGARLLCDP